MSLLQCAVLAVVFIIIATVLSTISIWLWAAAMVPCLYFSYQAGGKFAEWSLERER